MKVFAAIILLAACAHAFDFSKLKPLEIPTRPLFQRYNGMQWERIKKNQVVHRVHYPGYKPGTKPQPASAGHPLKKIDTRIVGGQVAQRGQFPWQALINMDNSYLCGGSLISETWVLSAGHCASDFTDFIIVLGAQKSSGGESGTVRIETTDKIVHEGYDPYNIDNDISVLRLPNPVQTSSYIGIIRLPPYSMASDDLVGDTVTISGWGKTSDNSGVSPELRYVSMPVMTNSECADYYGDVIIDSKLCTDTSGGRSTCNGDSGGPLILQMSDGGYAEVGIVSFGSSAGCESGYPAAFTRVTSFLEWIETNTGIQIQP